MYEEVQAPFDRLVSHTNSKRPLYIQQARVTHASTRSRWILVVEKKMSHQEIRHVSEQNSHEVSNDIWSELLRLCNFMPVLGNSFMKVFLLRIQHGIIYVHSVHENYVVQIFATSRENFNICDTRLRRGGCGSFLNQIFQCATNI